MLTRLFIEGAGSFGVQRSILPGIICMCTVLLALSGSMSARYLKLTGVNSVHSNTVRYFDNLSTLKF